MARYTDSKCRQCRREGGKLFLKGEKCFTEKCPVDKRAYAPGQHGQARRRKLSNGLHSRKGSQIYITRGIGTVVLPVRYQCPHEISLLELRAA